MWDWKMSLSSERCLCGWCVQQLTGQRASHHKYAVCVCMYMFFVSFGGKPQYSIHHFAWHSWCVFDLQTRVQKAPFWSHVWSNATSCKSHIENSIGRSCSYQVGHFIFFQLPRSNHLGFNTNFPKEKLDEPPISKCLQVKSPRIHRISCYVYPKTRGRQLFETTIFTGHLCTYWACFSIWPTILGSGLV